MTNQDDFAGMARELEESQRRSAETRASLEAEIARTRQRQQEIRARLQAGSPAAKRRILGRIWLANVLLCAATSVVGYHALLRHEVVLSCRSLCGNRGLAYVTVARHRRRSTNPFKGCLCRGPATSGCEYLRPDRQLCRDSILFSSEFYVVTVVVALFWPIIIGGLIGRAYLARQEQG